MIHSSAMIGEGVQLGQGVAIGPNAVLLGPLSVGDGTWIGAGAVLGAPPEITSLRQNVAWAGDLEHQGVVIGSGVVIRENVIVHQGSRRPTTVGDRTWLLNSCYLAHDVVVGPDATVSAGVTVGGHATIGARANIGMNAAIHQSRVVGAAAMVGMATPVTGDVPPFAKVYGTPPRLRGVNTVGLSRLGFSAEIADALLRSFTQGDLLLGGSGALAPLDDYLAEWRAAEPSRPVRVALGSEDL
jgi:UDP-N-acetylglucosamine acyltransferase